MGTLEINPASAFLPGTRYGVSGGNKKYIQRIEDTSPRVFGARSFNFVNPETPWFKLGGIKSIT